MPTNCFPWFARKAVIAIIAIMFSVALMAQTRVLPIKINDVQPPNWRMGTANEIVLRLSGEHLDGAVGVKVKHKGIRVTQVQHPDAEHLVVTLSVSPKAEPGTLMLQVFTRFMTTFAGVPMAEGEDVAVVHGELSATK